MKKISKYNYDILVFIIIINYLFVLYFKFIYKVYY